MGVAPLCYTPNTAVELLRQCGKASVHSVTLMASPYRKCALMTVVTVQQSNENKGEGHEILQEASALRAQPPSMASTVTEMSPLNS